MGYVRRFATSGKVELPQGLKREAELLYTHDIANVIETHKFLKSMVLNLDQTPVKDIPYGKTTLAKQNMSSVPVSSVSDKWMITATFTIALDGTFLPMQLNLRLQNTKNYSKRVFIKLKSEALQQWRRNPTLLKEVFVL